ncbi:MAG: hypothetical protein ACE5EL_07770, partial [Anaerolineae bacterium]
DGRVLYAGGYAGYAATTGGYQYDDGSTGRACCPDLSDDVQQYYMGAGSYLERASPDVVTPNRAGEGGGLWSGAGDGLDATAAFTVDLAAATAPVTLTLASWWDIEDGYDYGYLEARDDAASPWTSLPDLTGKLTDANPNGANLGWGLTGSGEGALAFDLSAFVGATPKLRLRNATDAGVIRPGWWADDVTVTDAGGAALYNNDFSAGAGDWRLAGWRAVPFSTPGRPYDPVVATGGPLAGLQFDLAPASPSAAHHSGAFIPTSVSMPPDEYPVFSSTLAARYDRPQDRPVDGRYALWSGMVGGAYQRLTRTVDLTAVADPRLTFAVSYSTAAPWEAVFVEAHTPGEDDWTTLADANGHTSPRAALSCTNNFWRRRHPQLAKYMTRDTSSGRPLCLPAGTSGEWNAATGDSDGWQDWDLDLSAFAGGPVEVSISYLSWGATPGVWLDQVAIAGGGATSFEDDLGGWTIAGPPPDSPPNSAEPGRATAEDFPVGAAVVTESTVMLGFGLENVAAEDRGPLMGRILDYLSAGEGPGRVFLPALRVGEVGGP